MRIIGVVSGKGGVGKTTTVANVGLALASEFGRRVAIVDSNLTTPNLGIHFGMYNYSGTFVDALSGKISIRQAFHVHPSGLVIIPTALSLYSFTTNAEEMRRTLEELTDFEFVLLDSAPGVEHEAVPVFEASDELLVVTNPEVPALTDALKSLKLADSIGTPVIGVEVNRVRKDRCDLTPFEIESVCDAPVIATIPERNEVRRAIATGNPVVSSAPYSPAAIEFKKLAAKLAGTRYSYSFIDKIRWRLGFLRRRY